MTDSAADIDKLKDRLESTWSAGDYGLVARGLQGSAEDFLRRQAIARGERVLDLACGAGQLAIPAARDGAEVTGIDIAENWIEQARKRADSEGLNIRFDVGDAESMPYEDEAFDVVISLIGAMFAPRPELATAEMIRVCRPGGRIIMGNWTPEGFIGRFFKLVAQYAPPPDMPSPLLWGDEETVTQRLGERVRDLALTRRMMRFDYPFPPADIAEHYLRYFGPTRKAFEALDERGRDGLRADLEALWAEANEAGGNATQVDAEILEVVAAKD